MILALIKTVHTLIWGVMATAVVYVVYCGFTGLVGPLLWYCVWLILLETAVLLVNKWRCPQTDVATHYATPDRDNFDIYLPCLVGPWQTDRVRARR